jgi:hypothetical protein
MSTISSVSSAVSQQTIALLQSQMMRYSQTANGQNSQASADYKALQSAIKSGNVSDAQAALARLQRDSQTANPTAATPASTSPTASSPVDSDGDHDGSTATAQLWNDRSINVTA